MPGLGPAADVDLRLVAPGVPEALGPQGDHAGLLEGRRQQPHQGQRRRRLAAARLAGERQGLPGLQREVDAVDDRVLAVQ